MADAPENFDRFKPAMPRIPGVTDEQTEDEKGEAGPRWKPTARMAASLLAAIALGAVIAWWTRATPPKASPAPTSTGASPQPSAPSSSAESPLPASSAPAAAEVLSDGSVVVANLRDLAKPWSSRKFVFHKPFTDQPVPAMVVRLPGGATQRSSSYWAFSLQAPFGRCELEYVADLSKLASHYRYRARHPMVADPCTGTVYDPLRLGAVGGGVWVRGEVVQGVGIRPPMAVEVRVHGQRLVATKIE